MCEQQVRQDDESPYRGSLDEIQRLRSNCSQIQENLARLDQTFRERIYNRYESTFGDRLGSMICDRELAESALRHEDPSIRRTALSLIADIWGHDELLLRTCYSILRCDTDSKVRAGALYKLGNGYANRSDAEILQLLVDIVENVNEDMLVRKAAYFAILLVLGHSVLHVPPPSKFQFPDDVDPEVIGSAKGIKGG